AIRFPEHGHLHRLSYFHRPWLSACVLQLQSSTPLPNIPGGRSGLEPVSPFFSLGMFRQQMHSIIECSCCLFSWMEFTYLNGPTIGKSKWLCRRFHFPGKLPLLLWPIFG